MRIAVVGHGLIGKQRARAVAALEAAGGDCRLAATVDPVPRAPDLYPGVPHYASLDDMPVDAFDAAVLALPHHLSRTAALAVLQTGRPVLVEKPLGLNGREAREIAAAAAGASGAGPASFVGYNYRFLPNVAAAVAAARSGALGELRSIDMFLGHGGHPRSAEEWKLDPAKAGGGVLIDPGVHLLDLLLCLAPGIQLRHVAATRGFWGTGIEEDVVAVLGEGPLLATLRLSHVRWINTFRVELGGTEGYALVEGRGGAYGPLTARFGRRWGWNDGRGLTQRQSEEARDFGPDNHSLEAELGAVVESWSGRAPAPDEAPLGPATFAEAIRVAELCDAAYRMLE